MNSPTLETRRARIEVRIERLILDGVQIPPRERAMLGAALEAEIGRLLIESGWGTGITSVSLPSLRAENIQWPSAWDASQLGVQIAQAVYGGLAEGIGGPA
jgi:hypothetical protein